VFGAVKVRPTTQVLPGPGAAGIVRPATQFGTLPDTAAIAKSVELAPVKYKLSIVNGPLPEFVSVAVTGVAVVVFGN
jgi:hypothetical protein